MSWSAPRTWVTGELVTSPVMNQHVRDDLLNLRVQREGNAIFGAREAAPVADGADRVFNSGSGNNMVQAGVDWTTLIAQGAVQWRALYGYYVSALNGCTALTLTSKIYREWSLNVQGGSHITLSVWAASVSVGWKQNDSGWQSGILPTADGAGVYAPSYRLDYATAVPTVLYLNAALFLRVV